MIKKLIFCVFLFQFVYVKTDTAIFQHMVSNSPLNNFNVRQLLEPSNKDIVYALLSSHVPPMASNPSIVTDNEHQELEIERMLMQLDRTQTIFGFWGLHHITKPHSNMDSLRAMQKRMKYLLENTHVVNALKEILGRIKKSQEDLLSYWDQNEPLQHNAKELYHAVLPPYSDALDSWLNHNKIALESSIGFEVLRSVLNLAIELGAQGVGAEAINSLFYNRPFSIKRACLQGLQLPMHINNPLPHVFVHGYDESKWPEFMAQGSAGDNYIFFKEKNFPRPISFLLSAAIVGCYDVSHALSIRDKVKLITARIKQTNLLQTRMVQIASFFRNIEELHGYLKNLPIDFEESLMQTLDCSKTIKIEQLFTLLHASTFNESATYWYSRGNVLLAHQLLCENKDHLIPTLQGLGIIDAFVSIVTVFQEYAHTSTPFCFVQFDDTKQSFALKDFWTPLMPDGQAIANSITLHDKINKIIITGPNGCGKSTIMKAAAHVILLAQSWTIVPATSATMSLFTGMRVSLNPKESLQHNLSTFMAEKQRVDAIRSFIASGNPDDIFFVLLDEPYRGTVAQEAALRVYTFGQEISLYDRCMMMMATHLEKPIELATTGVFANYQMGLIQESNGKFIRTFKLLEGAAHWWFHDIEKRMSFIDQLMTQGGSAA